MNKEFKFKFKWIIDILSIVFIIICLGSLVVGLCKTNEEMYNREVYNKKLEIKEGNIEVIVEKENPIINYREIEVRNQDGIYMNRFYTCIYTDEEGKRYRLFFDDGSDGDLVNAVKLEE